LADIIKPTDILICLPGLTLLGVWLLRTSLGRNALTDSRLRRNNMPGYMPLIPLFVWMGITSVAIFVKELRLPDLPQWQSAYLDNVILSAGAIAAMAVILVLACRHFARRLKGFGLNIKTIHRDFFAAVVNLISIYPLVFAALIMTIFFGKLIHGGEFELQKHQELETIELYRELPVRVMVVITAIVIVPVFEEMLFRGLFQTTIRSFISRFLADQTSQNAGQAACPAGGEPENPAQPGPARAFNGAWLSILASSVLFAAVHANAGHWPALFVLAVCMGYAYEKSGSLFRPIFIHSFFNAVNITAVLYSA